MHSVHMPNVFAVVVDIVVLSIGALALRSCVALVARLAMGRAVPRECASVWFRFDVLYVLQQTYYHYLRHSSAVPVVRDGSSA